MIPRRGDRQGDGRWEDGLHPNYRRGVKAPFIFVTIVFYSQFHSFSVHFVGRRGDLRVQSGERDELQCHLQLLRQDVTVPKHAGYPADPRRDAR